MQTALHPTFATILAGIQAQPAQLQRAEYLMLLRTADWSYEFSDDHRAYTAGRAQLARLRELRPVVDADGALWGQYAPAGHGMPKLAMPGVVELDVEQVTL